MTNLELSKMAMLELALDICGDDIPATALRRQVDTVIYAAYNNLIAWARDYMPATPGAERPIPYPIGREPEQEKPF